MHPSLPSFEAETGATPLAPVSVKTAAGAVHVLCVHGAVLPEGRTAEPFGGASHAFRCSVDSKAQRRLQSVTPLPFALKWTHVM